MGVGADAWQWSSQGLLDVRARGSEANATRLVPEPERVGHDPRHLAATAAGGLQAWNGPVTVTAAGRADRTHRPDRRRASGASSRGRASRRVRGNSRALPLRRAAAHRSWTIARGEPSRHRRRFPRSRSGPWMRSGGGARSKGRTCSASNRCSAIGSRWPDTGHRASGRCWPARSRCPSGTPTSPRLRSTTMSAPAWDCRCRAPLAKRCLPTRTSRCAGAGIGRSSGPIGGRTPLRACIRRPRRATPPGTSRSRASGSATRSTPALPSTWSTTSTPTATPTGSGARSRG